MQLEDHYHSINNFYKQRYGKKVYKLAVDAGFTCPNRDGTLDTRGCIFCSSSGSGDFAGKSDQLQSAKKLIQDKTNAAKFIVYFQAFTNTYAPVSHLKALFESVLIDESIVGISIATRPDCLPNDVIDMLKELAAKTDVYIELGLQTIHPSSASFIRRGFDLSVYDDAVKRLTTANLPVITHVIIGLPGETEGDILATIDYVAQQNVQGIKLQLLHILKDTDLYTYYLEHPFPILSESDYVKLIVKCIRRIPKHIIIHRLTGDGPKELLFQPLWSLNKRHVLNSIAKAMNQMEEL